MVAHTLIISPLVNYGVSTPKKELAYGESKRGQFITPGAVLVFELEILKVKGARAEF